GAEPPGGIATGEVVFNTVLSGYQEVLTDPSYAGQIITFTYPHIGNYGVTPDDDESVRPRCRGVIVRDLARRPSSWRSAEDLDAWLRRHGVPGMAGVDTRRLTRHTRAAGPGGGGPPRAPPPHPRGGRHARGVRHRRRAGAQGGGAGRARYRRRRPRRGRDDGGALPRRHRAPRGGRLRLRDQADDPAPSRAAGDGRGGAGIDPRRRRARP